MAYDFTPEDIPVTNGAGTFHSTQAANIAPGTWPSPLDESAFHGLAGRFVRAVEPHSEADPVALLVQTLVAFGNAVGRGPHFVAEAEKEPGS